jgi:predicted enzyme related to lactoylglutathione lyase
MSQPKPNSVVHLELHTADLRGAVDFYARLFG